jgi:hypothetical protein
MASRGAGAAQKPTRHGDADVVAVGIEGHTGAHGRLRGGSTKTRRHRSRRARPPSSDRLTGLGRRFLCGAALKPGPAKLADRQRAVVVHDAEGGRRISSAGCRCPPRPAAHSRGLGRAGDRAHQNALSCPYAPPRATQSCLWPPLAHVDAGHAPLRTARRGQAARLDPAPSSSSAPAPRVPPLYPLIPPGNTRACSKGRPGWTRRNCSAGLSPDGGELDRPGGSRVQSLRPTSNPVRGGRPS